MAWRRGSHPAAFVLSPKNKLTGSRGMRLMNILLAWVKRLNAALFLFGAVQHGCGTGPRTASNDLYHRAMLVLIGVSFVLVYAARVRTPSPR
jgi:hypothetical protein